MLPAAFVDADYRFNSAYMRGTKAIEPRWQRCVRSVDARLGEASGKLFVEKYFGPEGKQKIREIVTNVMAQIAAGDRDRRLDVRGDQAEGRWSSWARSAPPSSASRTSGATIRRWWSSATTSSATRCARASSSRADEAAKIGKPVDKTEWGMTPPTVNAYYDPQLERDRLPGRHPAAAVLRPHWRTTPCNYGAIGTVIGHELTHGFDDEGRKFDAEGNLDRLVDGSGREGVRGTRAACIDRAVRRVLAGRRRQRQALHLNGKLTLGENIADNGGLRMAYCRLPEVARRQVARDRWTDSRPNSASFSATPSAAART